MTGQPTTGTAKKNKLGSWPAGLSSTQPCRDFFRQKSCCPEIWHRPWIPASDHNVVRRLFGASPLFGACSAPRRVRRQRSAPSAPSAPASPFGARPHFYWFSQWFLQASTHASWTGFGNLWAQLVLFWGPQINVATTDSIARFRRNSTGHTGPVQKDAHLIADGVIHQFS